MRGFDRSATTQAGNNQLSPDKDDGGQNPVGIRSPGMNTQFGVSNYPVGTGNDQYQPADPGMEGQVAEGRGRANGNYESFRINDDIMEDSAIGKGSGNE